jgi:hypothetical protein
MDRSEGPGGGSSGILGDPPPEPPFSRFARHAVTGELDHCSVVDLLTGGCTGPNELVVGHRTSWGILPQTPVFSLRPARWSLITALQLIY